MDITIITNDVAGPITMSGGNDTFVIEVGASLSRQGALTSTDVTLSSNDSGNRVHVLGSLFGGAGIRLGNDAFLDTNNDVVIAAGGFVGAYAQDGVAVEVLGDSSEIINDGTIHSERGSACVLGPGLLVVSLRNDGLIESRESAATIRRAAGTDDVMSIVNNGTIRAANIFVDAYDGLDAANGEDRFENNGLIVGRVKLGNGADDLANTGTIDGKVDLGAGVDEIFNSGLIKDVISLGDGDDTYDGSAGRITQPGSIFGSRVGEVDGGAGNDTMTGGAGSELFDGGTGADTMEGRGGNDLYVIDNLGDIVIETANSGFDVVASSITITIGANIERVDLSVDTAVNATGNGLANIVQGRDGVNTLSGLAGNDQIFAFDGNDRLIGGAGADRLSGMQDADRFIFNSVTESRAGAGIDKIMDFSRAQGDKIQLSVIDADTSKAGNQTFSFIGTAAFSGKAGELRFQKTGTDSIITADVNGDGKADFTVISDIAVTFVKGDFIL